MNIKQHQLVNILRDKEFANTFELYRELGVSRATLHRYLQELSQKKIIKSVRGGAIFLEKDEDNFPKLSSYESREDPLYEERQRIGKTAVELVSNQESIILGTGRTTFALAKYLRKEKKKISVFTASLSVAYLLRDSSGELTVPGGTSVAEEGYLVGPSSLQSAKEVFAQKIFIGAGGININNGIMNHNSLIVELEKELIKKTKEIILLASHTKFNQLAPYVVIPLNKINTIITTNNISENYLNYFKENNIRLIFA